MKVLGSFFCFALLSVTIISCKKNDTPDRTGYNTKFEPKSISAIENGHQYSFGPINFGTTPEFSLQIRTTSDTANCSIWNVYLVSSDGKKYYIPGYGANGVSYYYADHYYSTTNRMLSIIVKHVSGPPEDYASILVINSYWR